ncbi:hypothetical protein H6802_01260 [Candidatus Nomurabacteria bacterium]|uniref:Uncharacterized protein n=1 Tax=candidate division WWE3 bacterium TaxID=2053526 RepID=A0A955E0X3_UNCKA|nr:hypothetical protein [candidate division WWE3 bacterium]MCB9823569.1 hypothetical protein [Candidatus Nomurabacteria bacterium]MCB9827364.1 hypothetical protein [Candidatus Nomurabacteria bacterium]HXK52761.1 hypothetical protein [bacterium]
MIRHIFNFYKIHFLISLTIAIIIITKSSVANPLAFVAVIASSIMGGIIFEADYLAFAYFLDKESIFSQTLRGYLKDKDFKNALTYTQFHKNEVTDKPLNSALFQFALTVLGGLIAFSSSLLFVKALVFSALAVSIYKAIQIYFDNNLSSWFWILKEQPKRNGFFIYIGTLTILLVYFLYLI